jgi:transposase
MKTDIKRIDVDVKELEQIVERARTGSLDEEDIRKLKAALETLGLLTELLGDKDTTIQRLRKILFGSGSEKLRQLLGTAQAAADPNKATGEARDDGSPANCNSEGTKRKGHGRNGAKDYTGAKRVKIPHESLKPGQICPDCKQGKVYHGKVPAYIVRLVGCAPIGATVFEMENLRCNLCLKVFTARPPEGVGTKKYDETSGSMIALLKYGSGFPFYRLERLQRAVGIPLPSATQWEIVAEVSHTVAPVYKEMIRQAAQGKVLHNDDTPAKILDLMKQRRRPDAQAAEDPKTRTGMFTSGIVSIEGDREIALFFTGGKHAGENLSEVLAQRAAELETPIQMCDGLSRNLPKEIEVILARCNAHARRGFFDVASRFPEECRHVLEIFAEVYKNDALAKEQKMSPEERLVFHQVHSGPVMKNLEDWLHEQLDEKKVEENSGLGQAIQYTIKHWEQLTLFLRVPGVPIDNNAAERILKKAILHRKASLFFKTEKGAQVGDLFMSLIHTCELCGANPFDYLTELQRHAKEIAESPQNWLPWNYHQNLHSGEPSPPASP